MKRAAPKPVRFQRIPTPVGDFVLVETMDGSIHSEWRRAGTKPRGGAQEVDDLDSAMTAALERYFEGDLRAVEALETPAGPPFFRRCWTACRAIPPGETISYAELASRAGSAAAVRAAGQAMRRNPLAIIVPCHRVVATGGRLYGYGGETSEAGWMLSIKRWLLDHERQFRVERAQDTEHMTKIYVNAWHHASAVAE